MYAVLCTYFMLNYKNHTDANFSKRQPNTKFYFGRLFTKE